MSKAANHGEWQEEKNKWGGVRRFRWIAPGAKEYETMVTVAGGIEIPQSELEDYHRRQAEQKQQLAATVKASPETGRICPFKAGRNQMKTDCKRDCPFYADTACILAITSTQPTQDTQGRYCPIAGRCMPSCAMYAGGCRFIELVKGMKPGKE